MCNSKTAYIQWEPYFEYPALASGGNNVEQCRYGSHTSIRMTNRPQKHLAEIAQTAQARVDCRVMQGYRKPRPKACSKNGRQQIFSGLVVPTSSAFRNLSLQL